MEAVTVVVDAGVPEVAFAELEGKPVEAVTTVFDVSQAEIVIFTELGGTPVEAVAVAFGVVKFSLADGIPLEGVKVMFIGYPGVVAGVTVSLAEIDGDPLGAVVFMGGPTVSVVVAFAGAVGEPLGRQPVGLTVTFIEFTGDTLRVGLVAFKGTVDSGVGETV